MAVGGWDSTVSCVYFRHFCQTTFAFVAVITLHRQVAYGVTVCVCVCVCVCVDGGGRKQTAGGTDIEQGRKVYIRIFSPCETLAHTHTWTTHKLTHSLSLSLTHTDRGRF